MDPSDPAYAGQATYTPGFLRAYDLVVVKLSNSWVWRCPAQDIQRFYDRHLTGNHLEVGPGTGYYLDRATFPDDTPSPRLTLLDPNPDVLDHAGRRLERYRPAVHLANALEPIDLPAGTFDSAALSFVLHCMPGDMTTKTAALDHLVPLVKPGGVVFGTTILNRGVDQTFLARRLTPLYNRKGIFSNADDDLDGLRTALSSRFDRYDLDVTGSVALFAGWVS
jgi:SAM-dependent methyltransferase